MRVLITGGAGFIGSHLAEHYQDRAEVRILDDFRTGRRSNLAGLRVDLREGSILDPGTLSKAVEGADFVFHLAALVSVPESVEKPDLCREINENGCLRVLEAAAEHGVKKVVFVSSAAVYGENPETPKLETMAPDPRSPYAATKLAGERLCAQFSGEGRVAAAALRLFNVFGPRQDPASGYAAAVPAFIVRALRGEALTVFGDGGQTRDFIYVKDVVSAMAFLAENGKANGVFNAGCGGRITIGELARKIVAEAGSASSIEYGPARPGDIRHSQASIEALRDAGWSPRWTLDAALAETIASYRKASN